MIRTRFAPSPTGDLHLGGVWVALASWIVARRARGAAILRVEDLDGPRVVPGSEEAIVADLAWLGLAEWDEETVHQSARSDAYEDALGILDAAGVTYPCDCSRAEIAKVASAPHAGEELVYPGTCRARSPARAMKRPPAIRLRVPPGIVAYDDGAVGRVAQDVATEVGDFVLRRGDGTFAYQLAVVVDDLASRVTDVLRGADLVSSTPRQILLARQLGAPEVPRYTHLPMVVSSDGQRLAKRTAGARVADLRAAGLAPGVIIGTIAHALGLAPDAAPRSPRDLLAIASTRPWPVAPFAVPDSWARASS